MCAPPETDLAAAPGIFVSCLPSCRIHRRVLLHLASVVIGRRPRYVCMAVDAAGRREVFSAGPDTPQARRIAAERGYDYSVNRPMHG